MKCSIFGLSFITLSLVAPTSAVASSTSCLSPATAKAADQQMSRWSNNTGIAISTEAKKWIMEEACTAVKKIAEEKPDIVSRLEELLPSAIGSYLDEQADSNSAPRNFGSILRASLGAQGLFRPGVRYLAKIAISYKRNPDYLEVNGEERPPSQHELFVTPGINHIIAKLNAKVLCSLSITATAGQPQQLNCDS